ncbi:hypothetical protein [Candidatus Cardinium hertigii]|jgi:hypothetical protein|uniref:hypothetical protein n=1 Tax=Candidatus Cardinium hertigii TaxID=247481 RepID=UPI00160860D8|nr:hypothetical protein [Candidatus Cardinium hertigii]
MKGNTKAIVTFLAVLLALLSIGMHLGVIAVPILAGYKFSMISIAFVLLGISMLC